MLITIMMKLDACWMPCTSYTVFAIYIHSLPDMNEAFTGCGLEDPGMCSTTLNNVSHDIVQVIHIIMIHTTVYVLLCVPCEGAMFIYNVA